MAGAAEDTQQDAVVPLLRQLSVGLGAYRLYPDEPERPAFVAAAERIAEAARRALTGGPVDVEIQGHRFRTVSGPLPDSELLRRLALCCYERGVERMQIRRPPDPDELTHLYRTLGMAVHAVREAGGVPALLPPADGAAIAIGELGPLATADPDRRPEELPPDQLELWSQLRDPVALAASLLTGIGGDLEDSDPAPVLERLEAMVSTFPEGLPEHVDVYYRLQEVILQLPTTLRRRVMASLLERHRYDPVAQRVIGTMSNAELARTLVDLREDGEDPIKLAERLAAAPGSRAHLVELTTALARGHEDAGTIMVGLENVGTEIDDRVWERSASVLETVSDLLARDLRASETEDIGSIRGAFPELAPVDPRAALAVLDDYLKLEADEDLLDQIVDLWAHEVGEAIRRRDEPLLVALTTSLRPDGAARADPRRATYFDAALLRLLSPSFLASIGRPDEEPGASAALLAHLGPMAVDALFDVLAEEPDRAARARLLGMLRTLAPASLDRIVRRLSDPRWWVVRNAVHILARVGGPDVPRLMAEAAKHPMPTVRREAVRGLAASGADPMVTSLLRQIAEAELDDEVRTSAMNALGGLAAPSALEELVGIARSSPNRRLQGAALAEIAGRPGDDAGKALDLLGSRRHRPRLPRALRKEARSLAAQRSRKP
jgi:HEAT repeat protein